MPYVNLTATIGLIMETQDSSDVLTRNCVQGQESEAMTWVDTVARMAAPAGIALILVSTAAGADLLANGNMEQTGSNPNSISGWSDWLWQGRAQISHTTAAVFEATRATLLQGFGPTKIAIFQKVALVPCSYRLTAAIAGMQLTAGPFDLSTAVFISYETGQPVLHQPLRRYNDYGGLGIDLPNWDYHVWMIIEDPGYLEYYPKYLRRTLLIEGQPQSETQTAPEFFRKYYMHADVEDWPGDDIWDRYIATRFHPREFDVMVSDGQLNLRFDAHGDAFALPLSALIIYRKIEEKHGNAFIAELWHRLKIQFDYEYRQVLPPLPGYARPPANGLGGKLRVFQRSLWGDVHATDWPESTELVESLKLNTHSIPISVHVHPWTLPHVDVPIGNLGASPTYPKTMFPEMGARRISVARFSLRLLRQHGLTMISGRPGGILFLGYRGAEVKLDVSQVTELLSEAKRLIHGEAGTYGGLAIAGLPECGKPYSSVPRDVLDAMRKRETSAGWLTLIHSIGDEPDGAEIENVLSLARVFKEAREGGRTMVFTSLTDIRSDERSQFRQGVSRIYLNVYTREALEYITRNGRECALYNQYGLYRWGVCRFKSSEIWYRGHLQFTFNSVHADPWYDLDGQESDIAAVYTHPDGSLRRSLDVVHYRDAVTDYRYLPKLEKTIAAGGKHSVRDGAQVYLQQITNSIEIDNSVPPPLEGSAIDRVREKSRRAYSSAHQRAGVHTSK